MKFTKKLIPISSKDITVVLLLYNTPHNLVKNLLVYKDFNILILDQSNDLILKTLNTNDYLMIKGSNSTGLFKQSQLLKLNRLYAL